MSTKRFIAKNGLDNNNQTITNVADPVNPGDVATKSVTDSVLSVAQSAYNAANNVGPQIQPAYEKANLAYNLAQSSYDSSNNNLVYVNSVNNAQNTRISTVEANTIYLSGALTQTNTNITSANTQLNVK